MISLFPITRMKTLVLLPRSMVVGSGVVFKAVLLYLITGRGKALLGPLFATQKVMSMTVIRAFSKIILTGVDYNGKRHPWF